MARGRLITFEGIDGSGKSTACRDTVAELSASNIDARHHVEPTPTWLGEAVRRGYRENADPWTEAFLFMADHATHVAEVRRHVASGIHVVSDRWSDSTLAYQGAVLARDDFDALDFLRRTEAPWDLKPDLTLLLDLDPAIAMRRVRERGATEKFERLEFLQKVRANYLRLAKDEPDRFVVLDGAKARETVLEECVRAIVALGLH